MTAATISREIARNASPTGVYASMPALSLKQLLRIHTLSVPKFHLDNVLWGTVLATLEWNWSPEQIAGILKRMWPQDPTMNVLHQAIYRATCAHPRSQLRRQFIACLCYGRSMRMPRKRGVDRRGQSPKRVSIHVRPAEVEDRGMPGHWEADFIKGAGNKSSVELLVERTSRLGLLSKMEDATAATAQAGLSAKLNSVATPIHHGFIYDKGKEMTRHREFTSSAGVTVYFCEPHRLWQHGNCENKNGLLCQFLPKGSDLFAHIRAESDAIGDSLNNQPMGPKRTPAKRSQSACFTPRASSRGEQ